MTESKPHKIYCEALNKWGAEAQTLMVFEEMSELQKELCKHARGKDNREAIAEEIADVQIMLEQMMILHDCEDLVEVQKFKKTHRLKIRLEQEKWEYEHGAWQCSNCGEDNPYGLDYDTEKFSNYCPRCGAKMDLED